MTHPTAPRGIHVPLVTPFAPDGRVAGDALEALAHTVLDAGAAGLVALGTTAEAATLDATERDTVVDVCARVCHERGAYLTVGAGNSDTRATARALAACARRPEIRAALVPVPSFTRPTPEGVLAHFRTLAPDSPLPLVVYHVPYRTARPLHAAVLRALAHIPGVAGIKLAEGRIDDGTVDLLGDVPADCSVLAGDDALLGPMLALGATGGILASAHLATDRFVALADAWQRDRTASARDLGATLARLSSALFAEPNPAVVKAVLHARSLIPTPAVRLPLLPASPGARDRALACLDALETARPAALA